MNFSTISAPFNHARCYLRDGRVDAVVTDVIAVWSGAQLDVGTVLRVCIQSAVAAWVPTYQHKVLNEEACSAL